MSNLSVSQRLHEELGKIISQTKPGDRLLSEPELASQLGVSRATLREAMRTFETQGMIRRRQGSGTFVTHPTNIMESGLEVLESIDTMAERKALPVTLGQCIIDTRASTEEEAQALDILSGENVLTVSRVMHADDRPVAYLIDILPTKILKAEDLDCGFSGSVLDLLLQRGSEKFDFSRTEITAVTASAEVARALGIQRGDVLLRFVAYLYTSDGTVADYSYSYFLPGYFRFHVVRRVG
jgi:GntR family transcriptional regulator